MGIALVVPDWFVEIFGCGGKAAVGWVPVEEEEEEEKKKKPLGLLDEDLAAALQELLEALAFSMDGVEGELILEPGQDVVMGGFIISWEAIVTIYGVGRLTGPFLADVLAPYLTVSTVTGEVLGGGFTLLKGGAGAAGATGGGMFAGLLAGLVVGGAMLGVAYGVIKGLEALGFNVRPEPAPSYIPDIDAVIAPNLMHVAFTDREISNIEAKLSGAKGPIDTGPSRTHSEMREIVNTLERMTQQWDPYPTLKEGAVPQYGTPSGAYGSPAKQQYNVNQLADLGFTEKNIKETLNLSDAAYKQLVEWERTPGKNEFGPKPPD